MASFDPGRLNRLVQIQRRTSAQDAIGQPLDTWTSIAAVWADIRQPSGLAAIKANAEVSVVQASIRIRYRTDINAGMRVVHGATVYSISAVLMDVSGRQWIDLVCQVVDA